MSAAPPCYRIVAAVSRVTGVPARDILGRSRFRTTALARHVAIYLMRTRLRRSYVELGREFQHADHTSAMHSARIVADAIERDPAVAALVAACLDEIAAPTPAATPEPPRADLWGPP
jgi:chromosomal replication initiator protein